MLSTPALDRILCRIPSLTIGVVGDLFLDRYLEIDPRLTEPSLETGLDAYQVVKVRSSPGAAGTVINNLAALGVQRIIAISVIGDDGEGYELLQALGRMPAVDPQCLAASPARRTPTYTKPLVQEQDGSLRELNRLDIKSRAPLESDAEAHVLASLDKTWPAADAFLVLDQVSEENCGVITDRVRERITQLAEQHADRWALADSRERIGRFRGVAVKPNRGECLRAAGSSVPLEAAVQSLAARLGRPVFCTCGEEGMLLAEPSAAGFRLVRVPAYPVTGPSDPVGAGDSTSAALACALAGGASLVEAASFANLVASITIQQLGTTGTASAEQIRSRWREVTSPAG